MKFIFSSKEASPSSFRFFIRINRSFLPQDLFIQKRPHDFYDHEAEKQGKTACLIKLPHNIQYIIISQPRRSVKVTSFKKTIKKPVSTSILKRVIEFFPYGIIIRRRTRGSNPQPASRHLISSQAANHSRILLKAPLFYSGFDRRQAYRSDYFT